MKKLTSTIINVAITTGLIVYATITSKDELYLAVAFMLFCQLIMCVAYICDLLEEKLQ